MDTKTESIIQRTLEILQKDRTTLIIAHRLSTIQEADIIFVLDHGTVKEQGNHDKLIEEKGLYYLMQQGRVRTSVL